MPAAWPSWLQSNARAPTVCLCIGTLGVTVRICRQACVDSRFSALSCAMRSQPYGQFCRIELAEQAKVVGDDPDSRDKTLRHSENVDRAYLDIALRRRHGAQWRLERANMASAHQECDDDPVRCLNGVQDMHAEPVEGLLQRPRPADQVHDGISMPFTTTGSAYSPRKAASASSQESTGCVHSGNSRSRRSITAPVCFVVAATATAWRGTSGHAARSVATVCRPGRTAALGVAAAGRSGLVARRGCSSSWLGDAGCRGCWPSVDAERRPLGGGGWSRSGRCGSAWSGTARAAGSSMRR